MKIAAYMSNINRYSGGRYYFWSLMYALKQIGHDVTVYTDKPAGFLTNNFRGRPAPKVKVGHENVKADLYMGMPVEANKTAANLAVQHGGKALCCLFDTLPGLERAKIKKHGLPASMPFLQGPNVWIVSLAEANVKDICSWCRVKPDRVKVIYPGVNDPALQLDKKRPRENKVAFISRMVKHKNLSHLADILGPFGIGLSVISSDRDDILENRGVKNVTWHIRADDYTKFKVLRQARCVCVPSAHEGFGMWAIEAWASGTPVVCYDLPTVREVDKGNTYFAKLGDRWELQRRLLKCLEDDKKVEPDKRFYFGRLMDRLREVLKEIA